MLIKSAPPQEWWVKLCDLGLSKRAEVIAGSTTVRGTPGFMPPEILGLNNEDPKSANAFSVDMWCLGEMGFQSLTGHGTFESIGKLIEYVKGSVEYPGAVLREAGVSESGVELIRSLMSSTPSQRPSAKQVLNHPWMFFGEEEMHANASSDSQIESQLEQLDLEGSDETSQASGEWTTEYLAKTTGGSVRERTITADSTRLVGSPDDPLANRIMNSSDKRTYMQEADEHGNIIEGTEVYVGTPPGGSKGASNKARTEGKQARQPSTRRSGATGLNLQIERSVGRTMNRDAYLTEPEQNEQEQSDYTRKLTRRNLIEGLSSRASLVAPYSARFAKSPMQQGDIGLAKEIRKTRQRCRQQP